MRTPESFIEQAEQCASKAQEAKVRALLEHDDTGGFGNVTEAAAGSQVWIHVPARGRLKIAVLSKRAFRYEGHWWSGSMHHCADERCDFCLRGIGRQVKFVLAVTDVDLGGSGLLELTPITAAVIAAQFKQGGFLRGLTFSLRHDGGKQNGKIVIEPTGAVLSLNSLPEPPDVEQAMRAQWAARGEL